MLNPANKPSSLFSDVKRSPYPPTQINSKSPLPYHPLTALHLTTQTSPLFISKRLSVPSTITSPTSLSTLTKTAASSSGLSTMLTPPVVSSMRCRPAGNCERKLEA